MKVKYFGYAEVGQDWYPLMSGEGLVAILDDEDPFDYIDNAFKMAGIEHYIVTYLVLEN